MVASGGFGRTHFVALSLVGITDLGLGVEARFECDFGEACDKSVSRPRSTLFSSPRPSAVLTLEYHPDFGCVEKVVQLHVDTAFDLVRCLEDVPIRGLVDGKRELHGAVWCGVVTVDCWIRRREEKDKRTEDEETKRRNNRIMTGFTPTNKTRKITKTEPCTNARKSDRCPMPNALQTTGFQGQGH